MRRSTLRPSLASASGPALPVTPATATATAARQAIGWRLALAALVASGGAYLVWSLVPAAHLGDEVLISDIAFLPASLLVALLAWHASRGADIAAGTRRAWRWIALAHLFLWAGDALWFVFEILLHVTPSPSVADVAYLAYYPTLVMGLGSFPRVLRSRMERLRFGLDTATVVLGGAMVAWFVLIGPVATMANADPMDTVLSLAYPVGDLVLLLGIVMVGLRSSPDLPRSSVVALLSGLLAFLAADTLYGVQALDDTYAGGGLVDALSVAAWTLTGIGAYLGARRPSALRPEPAARADGIPLAPYAAVVIGFAMLLIGMGGSWSPTIAVLVAGAGGLTVLVMARQLVTARENVGLVAGEHSRHAEMRLRSLVENSTDLIVVTDAERAIQYATPSVERALRLTSAQLIARSFDALVLPDDLTTARAMMNTAQKPLPGVAPATYELRLVRHDGRPLAVEASVADRRDDPEMGGLVITLHDIERRKALEAKLARQAFHDPLTGLASSGLFHGSLAKSVTEAQAWGTEVGLVLIQMDGFSAINERHGRAGGDALLAEAAQCITGAIRPDDLLGRLGGDEFAVLLGTPVSVDAADAVAERILAFLRVPLAFRGVPATLSASIGIVVSPPAGRSPDDLLQTATAAAVAAKRLGRDRWVRSGSSPFS